MYSTEICRCYRSGFFVCFPCIVSCRTFTSTPLFRDQNITVITNKASIGEMGYLMLNFGYRLPISIQATMELWSPFPQWLGSLTNSLHSQGLSTLMLYTGRPATEKKDIFSIYALFSLLRAPSRQAIHLLRKEGEESKRGQIFYANGAFPLERK